jgi:predicted RNase H-like nuclease (RuvC/YqgF family)
MKYTLGQAAKLTDRSKATISGDLKSGKLSGEKQENGSYAIDASELMRVYGDEFNPNRSENTKPNDSEPLKLVSEHQGLPEEVKRLREQLAGVDLERERERRQLTDQIADLRRRLDAEGEERRKLTAILTDQRSTPVQTTPVPQKSGFWGLFRRQG